MRHGKPSDYEPPFRDGPHGSWREPSPLWDAEVSRVVGIGRAELQAWWERVKRDTSPGTFGQTDHEFTSAVAFYLANGGPSETSLAYAETDFRAAAAIKAYTVLAQ